MKTCIFEISPSIYNLEENILRTILPECIDTYTIKDMCYHTLVTRFKLVFTSEHIADEYSYTIHGYRFRSEECIETVYTIRNAFKFIPKGVEPKKVNVFPIVFNEYRPADDRRRLDRNAAPFILSYVEEEKVRFSPVPPEENECLDQIAGILFEHAHHMQEGKYLKLMNYLQKKRNYTV